MPSRRPWFERDVVAPQVCDEAVVVVLIISGDGRWCTVPVDPRLFYVKNNSGHVPVLEYHSFGKPGTGVGGNQDGMTNTVN